MRLHVGPLKMTKSNRQSGRTYAVAEVMTKDVQTISLDTTAADALAQARVWCLGIREIGRIGFLTSGKST
jgi:hypothetical protein